MPHHKPFYRVQHLGHHRLGPELRPSSEDLESAITLAHERRLPTDKPQDPGSPPGYTPGVWVFGSHPRIVPRSVPLYRVNDGDGDGKRMIPYVGKVLVRPSQTTLIVTDTGERLRLTNDTNVKSGTDVYGTYEQLADGTLALMNCTQLDPGRLSTSTLEELGYKKDDKGDWNRTVRPQSAAA